MIGEYKLNEIYNEDCYEAIRKIPDKSIDCIYTDIPYLYDSVGGGDSELAKRITKVSNDYLKNIRDGIDFSIFEEMVRTMKYINIFIWCSKLQILELMNYFINEKKCNFEILTWNKTNPTPATNGTWLPDIEYCLYFKTPNTKKYNDGYELKLKWYQAPINKKDKDLYDHPTIKPLELVKRHLLHTTNVGGVVADFFLGSGTTCVAAKEIGRQYIGFEIDKQYFKIAKDRLNGINANGQQSIFTNFEQNQLDI